MWTCDWCGRPAWWACPSCAGIRSWPTCASLPGATGYPSRRWTRRSGISSSCTCWDAHSMSFSEWWLAYIPLGAFVGFFAGLLGVGGGSIMVPLLTTLFAAQDFPHEHLVHMALGTSMAAIVMTSMASLRAHHGHGAVLWPVVRYIAPGVLAGTFLGTFIASRVPTRPLAIFFTCFMAYVVVQMLLNIKPNPSRELPGPVGMSAVGMGIGGVSALILFLLWLHPFFLSGVFSPLISSSI